MKLFIFTFLKKYACVNQMAFAMMATYVSTVGSSVGRNKPISHNTTTVTVSSKHSIIPYSSTIFWLSLHTTQVHLVIVSINSHVSALSSQHKFLLLSNVKRKVQALSTFLVVSSK